MSLEARSTIIRLRDDAIKAGMHELAIAYGWSALRLGDEEISRITAELNNAAQGGCPWPML